MKIICDNICYVERKDLNTLNNIPYWVQVEVEDLETEGLFVKFKYPAVININPITATII